MGRSSGAGDHTSGGYMTISSFFISFVSFDRFFLKLQINCLNHTICKFKKKNKGYIELKTLKDVLIVNTS